MLELPIESCDDGVDVVLMERSVGNGLFVIVFGVKLEGFDEIFFRAKIETDGSEVAFVGVIISDLLDCVIVVRGFALGSEHESGGGEAELFGGLVTTVIEEARTAIGI